MTDCINEEDLSVQNAEISSTHEPKAKINCIYGDECYRRNPEHRLQFYHPGDADDISQKNENHEPICRYGALCYRKNPDHRKQFRHDVIIGTQNVGRGSYNRFKRRRCEECVNETSQSPVSFISSSSLKAKRKWKNKMEHSIVDYLKEREESRQQLMEKLFVKENEDDISSFGKYISAVLRKLNPQLQIRAKKELFSVLTDHESMAIEMEVKPESPYSSEFLEKNYSDCVEVIVLDECNEI